MHTESGPIKLKSVKYVPSMTKNLISVGALADSGHKIVFSDQQCWIINEQGCIVGSGHRDLSNGLYSLKNMNFALATVQSTNAELWHRRLGHLSYAGLYYLSSLHSTTGMPFIERQNIVCHCCLAGKQHRKEFPHQSKTRADKPATKIHSDVIGPMQQTSLGGSKYILVFTNDYSRKCWVYFLKNKSDTFSKFCKFKKRIELETGNRIQVLRSDRGGEYLSDEFKNFCAENAFAEN